MQINEFQLDNTAIYQKLASELGVGVLQVQNFAELYDDGASVPFIARYRKDKTGGLDDTQLRQLEKSLVYERELEKKRHKTKELLATQNVLNDELIERINQAVSKLELDEIYAPYRPRRRSLSAKATLAGLDVCAKQLLAGASVERALADYQPVDFIVDDTGEQVAVDYSTKELQIAGMSAIIIDEWATHLELLDKVRLAFNATAMIESSLIDESKADVGEKFKDYFEHSEPFAKVTSHRLLAMLRGRDQEILTIKIVGEDTPMIDMMTQTLAVSGTDERAQVLQSCVKKLWQDKWRPQIEHRLLTEHHLKAQSEAIEIFATNLHHLLMTAPAGRQVILGADPGYKNGVKMAVIDTTGDVLATKTIYPFGSEDKLAQIRQEIAQLIATHQVSLVAIGNGTASRETEELMKQTIKEYELKARALVISEAGASVYSASELASSELPELDVSLRGAVSIARRLQDPLSELVKVEPKAIGVGQYQHDVNQSELESSLDKVTEDCVNAVGVDVNTASPSILAYIAGLNKNVAEQIVKYRRANGEFSNRDELKRVPRLGVKTFEQAAGFLRIKSGDEPLDATGVHPESYGLVYEILARHHILVQDAIGNAKLVDTLMTGIAPLTPEALALAELAKSRHDPRGEFRTATFRDDVNSIKDLQVGMVLEGVVTNVTGFGCFVDVGVHQDGLVHISELSDDFVENPSDVVKPFDIVKVRVISVDEARGRIGFSMKTKEIKGDGAKDGYQSTDKPSFKKDSKSAKPKPPKADQKTGSFGALLKQALK